MTFEHQILRETARFLDSAGAAALGPRRREAARQLAHAWFAVCFDALGKAPALLDGEDVAAALLEHLPAHLGARDPLAKEVGEVLDALLVHLELSAFVPHAFEQRQALAAHLGAFEATVQRGDRAGRARALPPRPIVHRAEKTGRNDPCPCGSGKKFKGCCARL